MSSILEHVLDGFERSLAKHEATERRIGAELKFPLVNLDGAAVSFEKVKALLAFLQDAGWDPDIDSGTRRVIGVRLPGEQNDTAASCETGFCKSEFSLAHVSNLADLERSVAQIRKLLHPFAEKESVRFLGYGIQPVTPPGKHLLMKRSRTSVWDKAFGSNRHVPPEDGDDFHLFTINAASHVHVSVGREEAMQAVNVLNGFAGAQIALTAHSNIWRGRIDPEYKCVSEMFWDWWMPDAGRVGIPHKPFDDLEDYVRTIARLKPVYVKREGRPVLVSNYDSFQDYFEAGAPVGSDLEGCEVPLVPQKEDIDLHSRCYWYNARLSRYYTVESRVCDQQPPEDLLCIAALTLGLVSALPEAWEVLSRYKWDTLRRAREAACREALDGSVNGLPLRDLAERMLDVASLGLRRRGRGEETCLGPLERRLAQGVCPADDAARIFEEGGAEALVSDRSL